MALLKADVVESWYFFGLFLMVVILSLLNYIGYNYHKLSPLGRVNPIACAFWFTVVKTECFDRN